MRLLFVKDALSWPRTSGHDVHGSGQMRALRRLGHEVVLLTRLAPAPEALADLDLTCCTAYADQQHQPASPADLDLTRLQQRFLSYWGIDAGLLPATAAATAEWRPDAVIALDLTSLPCLAAVRGTQRVWYAADEWTWHHLSQLRLLHPRTWGEGRAALIKLLYERAFAPCVDRFWVASETDRRAMRWATGRSEVTVMAHGVDHEHFRPLASPQLPTSCVFWGNLNFGPNVQALTWFCSRVWPKLHERFPTATFTIYGRRPQAEVLALTQQPGVCVVADLPDLREVARHEVVVMPFISGGGIKNKLLEAASLGRPIVGSPWACGGLSADAPLVVVQSPAQWVEAIVTLWEDEPRRRRLGELARQWICTRCTWESAARAAVADLGGNAVTVPVPARRDLESVSA